MVIASTRLVNILSTVMTCGFEGLKLKGEQTLESRLVATRRFGQTLYDGLLEDFKVLIVGTVETFFALRPRHKRSIRLRLGE